MQNLAKYALKYAAYMWHCGNMWRKWRMLVCLRVGQNAQKCWKMRSHMRKYAIIWEFLQIYA